MKQIKIKGQIFDFSNWTLNFQFNDWMKKDLSDSSNFIILCNICIKPRPIIEWLPSFHGPKFRHLNRIYDSVFPEKPIFLEHQLLAAQQHVDKFLEQSDSLSVFL